MAYVTWATMSARDLTITGEPTWWASSARAHRGFCGECGTSLFFRPVHGDFIDVTVATFDDPAPFGPSYVIWTAARLPWVVLDARLPAHADDGPDTVAR